MQAQEAQRNNQNRDYVAATPSGGTTPGGPSEPQLATGWYWKGNGATRAPTGFVSESELLDAWHNDADARMKALDGEASLLQDFVALQKSLGLGWRLEA